MMTEKEYDWTMCRLRELYSLLCVVKQNEEVCREVDKRFDLTEMSDDTAWPLEKKFDIIFLADLLRWMRAREHRLGDESDEELCCMIFLGRIVDSSLSLSYRQINEFKYHTMLSLRELYDIPEQMNKVATDIKKKYIFEDFICNIHPAHCEDYCSILSSLLQPPSNVKRMDDDNDDKVREKGLLDRLKDFLYSLFKQTIYLGPKEHCTDRMMNINGNVECLIIDGNAEFRSDGNMNIDKVIKNNGKIQ